MNKIIVLCFSLIMIPFLSIGQFTKIEELISLDGETFSLQNVNYKNERDQLVETRKIAYNGKSENDWLTISKLFYRDTLLWKVETISKENESEIIKALSTYDVQNKLTNLAILKNDETNFITQFLYNAQNQLVQEIGYCPLTDKNGKLLQPYTIKKQYVYCDNDLCEEWTTINDAEKIGRYQYSRFIKGGQKVTEKLLMDDVEDVEKQRFVEVYNKKGQLIEDFIYFKSGSLFRSHKYFYNRKNKLMQILEFGSASDKPIVIIKYQYSYIKNIN